MTHADPRLIRLLARRFNGLKGFVKVPFAVAMATAAWAWSQSGSVVAAFVGGGAGVGIGLVAYLFIAADTYERLGRVVTSERSTGIGPGLIGGGVVVLNRLQTEFIPGPSVVWLASGFYLIWLAIDGWPWRWYYVLTAASAVYVAFGRTVVAHPSDFAWMTPRVWVFALSFLLTAIADHVLLLRTMRMMPFEIDTESEDADSI